MMKIKNKSIYFNKPQIIAQLVRAHEEYHIWGRGTGKSEGLMAPRSAHNLFAMPRGAGLFLGATYQQILARTLPPVVKMWGQMGYERDKHYFIGKRPPKVWKWPKPILDPLSCQYAIIWYNGSLINLVSQDRAGSSNSLSVDWLMGDEAKFLSYEKLINETMQTNRGNQVHFGHLPEHHSLLFCTDMPTTPRSKWILDKEDLMDKEQVELILGIHGEILKLKLQYDVVKSNGKRIIEKKIKKYEQAINEMRFNLVHYSEFSALENVEVLGMNYIKLMKRTLPPLVFRTSVMNECLTKIEDCFYPLLDESKHTYDSYNYTHIDSLDYNLNKIKTIDCRHDGDVDQDTPLDIALDYGASINCMVMGQQWGKDYRIVNDLYVKNPLQLKDVVNKFCTYYSTYRCRDVNYYYDHTAVGRDALRDFTYADEVMRILEKNNWNVTPIYIGQAPRHDKKYHFWNVALGNDERLPLPQLNRYNCSALILSMQQAGVKQGKNGFEKDKSAERDPNVPQEEATHLSDAADTLFYGKFSELLSDSDEFFENIYLK